MGSRRIPWTGIVGCGRVICAISDYSSNSRTTSHGSVSYGVSVIQSTYIMVMVNRRRRNIQALCLAHLALVVLLPHDFRPKVKPGMADIESV